MAVRLNAEQIERFYGRNHGGFFDVAGADPTLLVRPKETYDGAEPSGNSIAPLNLLRLSTMLDNAEYREMADTSFTSFGSQIQSMPQALTQFLVAADFGHSRTKLILIAGRNDNSRVQAMLREVHAPFNPVKILLLADDEDGQGLLASHAPFYRNISMIGGMAAAYVCEDYTCGLPTSDLPTHSAEKHNRDCSK